MAMTKKQYTLEGLCCGNCAAKIQKDVQALAGEKMKGLRKLNGKER